MQFVPSDNATRVPFLDLRPATEAIRREVEAEWASLLDANRFVGGAPVEWFEEEWAAYCGTDYAVAVGNGTDALQLVLRALGVGPGDEVVVPANTFIATAEAVVLAGATPRFADVDPDTLLLTGAALSAAVTPRTVAVLPVHLYGQPVDMDDVGAVADRHGLAVVEDAAQAHGALWGGRRAGSLGVAGCFSFYPGKNLGAFGDGGAVVTSDAELARRLRSIADHGRTAGSHYEHGLLGTNSRLDSLQAAVLSAKLRRLDGWNAARREVARCYDEGLRGSAARPVREAAGAQGAYHLYVVRVPDRDGVRSRLDKAGVDTGVHYPVPCHQHEPYDRYPRTGLPVASAAAGELLSLPMFPQLGAERAQRVMAALVEALEDATR
jgi:dTDP-4-amino-4,6-dideoxygalactose transaminase